MNKGVLRLHHTGLWPIQCEDTKEIVGNYVLYNQSNHWKRIKVLFNHSSHHRGQCYVCGSKEKLHLHHKTYERIGHEDMGDFQELCERCHNLVHNLVMTGRQLGIDIGNAADKMLGEKEPGTHRFSEKSAWWASDCPAQKPQRRHRRKGGSKRKAKSVGLPSSDPKAPGVLLILTPPGANKPKIESPKEAQPQATRIGYRNLHWNVLPSEKNCPTHGLVHAIGDKKGYRRCPECGKVLCS